MARTNEQPAVVAAKDIVKTYKDGERELQVLKGVSLAVNRGESLAIIGRSGSGKSTLLHILGALDRPSSGTVHFDGIDLATQSETQLAELRAQRVGFIYQFHHLLPEFSALENVLIPGMVAKIAMSHLVPRAEHLLKHVGLADRMSHRPAKLSGGERQRVALARALMNDPDLVIADEPTGDLDQDTGREVLDFVVESTVSQGKALIMVTHDLALAKRLGRTMSLVAGRLE